MTWPWKPTAPPNPPTTPASAPVPRILAIGSATENSYPDWFGLVMAVQDLMRRVEPLEEGR